MFGTFAPRLRALVANAACRIFGGGANQVLYQDVNQNLGSSNNLTFDGTNLTATGDVVVGSSTTNRIRLTNVGGQPGIWLGTDSPTADLAHIGYSTGSMIICGGGNIYIRIGNVSNYVGYIDNSGWGIGGINFLSRCHIQGGTASQIRLITEAVTSQTGAHWSLRGQSSTTAGRNQAVIDAVWVTSTDASRTARMVLKACDYSGTDREGLRIESDGTQALLSYFGVVAVAKQTGGAATAGGTYTSTEQGMIQRMYDALRNYGLLT